MRGALGLGVLGLLLAWWLEPQYFAGKSAGICAVRVVYAAPVEEASLVGAGLTRPAPNGAELAVACQEPGSLQYRVGGERREQPLTPEMLRRGEVTVVELP
ncbi:MAG: hypothetical protein KIT72_10775 [Polyangiaceae bacterium]|nr:hypothetical protein [Polyangiaceae bacterium]MCW5790896.1 hypothetical protein [Polyangiaceae bacterium]